MVAQSLSKAFVTFQTKHTNNRPGVNILPDKFLKTGLIHFYTWSILLYSPKGKRFWGCQEDAGCPSNVHKAYLRGTPTVHFECQKNFVAVKQA